MTLDGQVDVQLYVTLWIDSLPCDVLQEIAQERYAERPIEARGLLAKIDIEFIE